jgi:very-short-patch-repair endonuclease
MIAQLRMAANCKERQRDRDLQIRGFSIFRYAGSEICSNVFRCAQEVIEFLVEAVEGQQVAEQDTGNSLNG